MPNLMAYLSSLDKGSYPRRSKRSARSTRSKKYGMKMWDDVVSPVVRGLGRGARYTAKKGYQGVAYISPKIYHGVAYVSPKIYHGVMDISPKIYRGTKRVLRAMSPIVTVPYKYARPHVIRAAKASGRAAHKYIVSPTYEWLAGHANRAKKSAKARALAFHEYMMSP